MRACIMLANADANGGQSGDGPVMAFIASDALIPIFSIAAVHGADMIEMLTPVHVLHAVGSNSVSDL